MLYDQLYELINKWMNITDEYMAYEQLNELINEWILPINIWYTNSWMN